MGKSPYGNFGFLALFVGFLLTFWLGSRGLNEPDEGRYAEMALELVKGQASWWEPKLSGYNHYDKPPLIYWTAALAFKVFGPNESAARGPSLLGAALTLLGVGWTALRLYGRDVAWWSILICGTLGQFWLLARFLTPDMLLTGWCTLAIAAWAECRHRNASWRYWFLSLAFWTLAWWTKATAALVPLLGLAAGVWILRDDAGKKALRLWLLLPGILILGSPWYVSMMLKHGELVGFFFGRELVGRVAGHVTGRTGPIYYYLALGLVGWLPWWPLLLGLGFSQRQHWPRLHWRWLSQAVGWEGWTAGVGVLIFSFISSKLPTYTLTLAPWVALLMARSVIKFQAVMPLRLVLRWVFFALAVYVPLILSAAVIVSRFEAKLGVNSSMRPLAEVLQQRGAQAVLLDRYWPGMEFYFGQEVFYLVSTKPSQLQSGTESQEPARVEHFWQFDSWRQLLAQRKDQEIWLVRYLKNLDSPLLAAESSARVRQRIRLGDFMLSQIGEAPQSTQLNLTNLVQPRVHVNRER